MADEKGRPGGNVVPLTAEEIRQQTGYGLLVAFTEFNGQDGSLRPTAPQIAELRDRWAELGGDHSPNVLPSFYRDEEGLMRLGIFQRPLREQPFVHPLDEVTERVRRAGTKGGRVSLHVVPRVGEAALGPDTPRPRGD